jgi:hypothetical protein
MYSMSLEHKVVIGTMRPQGFPFSPPVGMTDAEPDATPEP